MFEQSILLPTRTRKPWTIVASAATEVAAVGILLMVPLIYTEKLGMGSIQPAAIRPMGATLAPLPVHHSSSVEPLHRSNRVFRPSTLISTRPRTMEDLITLDADDVQVCPNCANVLATNERGPGIYDGNRTIDTVPPPKPAVKPVETKKPAEPKPAPAAVRVNQGTQEAKILRRVLPSYPPLARQMRVQGTVKLVGVISREGVIEQLQVLSGHPLLVRAAVDAVKQWLYRPTLLSGEPVEVIAPIEVNFILSN